MSAGEIVRTLTTEELADLLGITVETVRRMRRRGQGPDYVVLAGGHVRYYQPTVDAWLRGGGNRAVQIKREE
jgi:excisionase family DNA binding protein